MKFIFATGIFPPDIGGPATYIENLAVKLHQRGFDIRVVTYSDKLNSKLKNQNAKLQFKIQNYDFPVVRISRKYPKILRHFIYFLKLLKLAENCDVLYAQNPVSVGFPALLTSKILRKKLVVKIVGDAAWESYVNKVQSSRLKVKSYDNIDIFQNKTYDFFTELNRKIEKFVAKNAARLIVPSQYLKNMISGWGIPGDKITVIYNAAEKINFALSKEKAKREIGIEGDIILSIGRLVPWKGFEALIGIMPDLLKENSNFKLLIVGEGEEKESLKFKVKSLKLENNVKLVGKVSHKNIPFYFKAADIFVLNSEYEGLSHVLLEAMQYGAPIAASDKGGNPELIVDNFSGFLTEYNNKERIRNAILKLWRDKELCQEFIKNSQEKLKEFSCENLVEKTLEVLKA